MPLRFLFVDFNSYFASVEQQERPELRGKPVAVVPVLTDTTSCIAASYEAKRFGVRTGTRVSEAKRLCPGLVVVRARPGVYVDYHHRLIAAVDSVVPVQKVLSIDEMACELTGSQQDRVKALSLARQVKQTVFATVGTEMRSSIGIAPTLWLSKTASDMQKPDGCVVIQESDLPECLYKLDLSDLTGIGAKMKPRLEAQGIRTVRALCTADKALLRSVWGGVEGERMYARLRGQATFDPPTQTSTIGHSHVLPPSEREPARALAVLHRLLQKAAMRLRKDGYRAGGMQVSVRFLGNERWGETMSFTPTEDTLRLTKALSTLWEKRPPAGKPPLAVGVTLIHLTQEKDQTLPLFEKDAKVSAFHAAIDKLNARYGKNTVYFGGAHAALDSAPTRIAFTHIPDYD
jgi:DNA polymerase-4